MKTAVLGEGEDHDPKRATAEDHARHHPLGDPAQHLLVRPIGLGHEVMQRLVAGAGVQRINAGGHRLHALALQRQHQPGAIASEPRVSVGVPTQPLNALYCSNRSAALIAPHKEVEEVHIMP